MADLFRTDVRHVEHPDLAARTELAASALAALHFVLRPEGRRITKLGLLADVARNKARLDAEVAQHHTKFIHDIVREVRRAFVARAELAAHKSYLRDFESAAKKIACDRCTNKRQCSGSPLHDPRVLADPDTKALCLDFILSMFESLVKLASQQYQLVLQEQAGGLTLRLATTVTGHNETLGGETKFPLHDCTTSRRAEITVTLPVQHFRNSHLALLPYVLFHEIFVHGPEGWWAQGSRPTTLETCSFREGFVDAAAVYVLCQALTNGSVKVTSHRDVDDLLAKRVGAAHELRTSGDPTAPNGTSTARAQAELRNAREYGANIFRALEKRGHGDFAVRLATAINVMDTTEVQRLTYLRLLKAAARNLVPRTPSGHDGPWNRFAVQLRNLALQPEVDVASLRRLLDEHVKPSPDALLDDFDF